MEIDYVMILLFFSANKEIIYLHVVAGNFPRFCLNTRKFTHYKTILQENPIINQTSMTGEKRDVKTYTGKYRKPSSDHK